MRALKVIMRTSKRVSKSDKTVAQFSGDVLEWFQFDRGIQRAARKLMGSIGQNLWLERLPPVTDENAADSHPKILQAILENVGVKEYTFYKGLEEFQTAAGMNAYLMMMIGKILDIVEDRCNGLAFTFITDLEDKQHLTVRSLLMQKFVTASAQQTLQMEQFLENGLMKDHIDRGFPPDMNMEDRLDDMENVQHTLQMICPEEVRGHYRYSKTMVLVRVLVKHLNAAYRPDFNRILMEHKSKLRAQGVDVPEYAAVDMYTDEYLPAYGKVRQQVVQTFHQLRASKGGASSNLPLMITNMGRR